MTAQHSLTAAHAPSQALPLPAAPSQGLHTHHQASTAALHSAVQVILHLLRLAAPSLHSSAQSPPPSARTPCAPSLLLHSTAPEPASLAATAQHSLEVQPAPEPASPAHHSAHAASPALPSVEQAPLAVVPSQHSFLCLFPSALAHCCPSAL